MPTEVSTPRRLTLGVSGHRPGAKYHDAKRVRAMLDKVFRASNADVVSALAEGVDRDAAHAALAAGGGLIALTPFDHADYQRDFAGDASIAEFQSLLQSAKETHNNFAPIEPDGSYGPKRDRAYAQAGFDMLARVDGVILVWNGKPGGLGGVSTVRREARRKRVPIYWIHSMVARPGRASLDGGTRWLSGQKALASFIEAARKRRGKRVHGTDG